KGDYFKLLIFSSSPLGVRGKNGKNQQFEGFLYCTHLLYLTTQTFLDANNWFAAYCKSLTEYYLLLINNLFHYKIRSCCCFTGADTFSFTPDSIYNITNQVVLDIFGIDVRKFEKIVLFKQ
ncbi:MAG: hypothetical protein PWQ17_1340, partial [Anaerophaga sp.]|nr:hypothetical protein [Anaerophaga sp.]